MLDICAIRGMTPKARRHCQAVRRPALSTHCHLAITGAAALPSGQSTLRMLAEAGPPPLVQYLSAGFFSSIPFMAADWTSPMLGSVPPEALADVT